MSGTHSRKRCDDGALVAEFGFALDLWVDPVRLEACFSVDGVAECRQIHSDDIARLVSEGYRLKTDDRLGCSDRRHDGHQDGAGG